MALEGKTKGMDSVERRYVAEVREFLEKNESIYVEGGEWQPSLGFQKSEQIRGVLEHLVNAAHQRSCYRLQGIHVRGTIIGPSVKLKNSVLTILRDLQSPTLVALQVCYCVNTKTQQDQAARLFLPGTVVVLKEPLIAAVTSQAWDHANPVLVIPSPADMEIVSFVPVDEELARLDQRGRGKRLFRSGSYVHACLSYSAAAQEANAARQKVVMLSNLAQTYLNLGMVDRAILSACKALEIDPVDVKSLYRKSQGLLAMREYVDALNCMQTAAALESSLKTEADRCRLLCEQSVTGVYDIGQFVSGGLRPVDAPNCADFVGPVVVKGGEFGRGLYVTEDVKKGHLLLVSNPIAALYEEEPSTEDLMVNLIRVCRGSSKALAQLNALAYSHDRDREVPPMNIFRPNVSWTASDEESDGQQINVWKMEETIALASFGRSATVAKSVIVTAWRGVWGLPALINHSCLPTVTRTDVGPAMFVRAARDLSAGEELVWSYTYSAAPWSEFRKHKCYGNWQFYCSCKRCETEQRYEHVLQNVGFDFPLAPAEGREVVVRLEEALRDLPEEEKKVIRAGYVLAYLECTAEELRSVRGCPSPVELMATVHEVMPGCEGSMLLMTGFCKMLKAEAPAMWEEAQQLVEEETRALFGQQNGEVVSGFVEAWVRNTDVLQLQGHL